MKYRSGIISSAFAAIGIAILSGPGAADASVRRTISKDSLLILFNAPVFGWCQADCQRTNWQKWNDIPADLRPYCGMILDDGARSHTTAQWHTYIDSFQNAGIPHMLQIQCYGACPNDDDTAWLSSMAQQHSLFQGVQICESDDISSRRRLDVLRTMAQNGCYFAEASMGGWNINADSCSKYKDNLFIMDKPTWSSADGQYITLMGNAGRTAAFFLAGVVDHWGSSPDHWWANICRNNCPNCNPPRTCVLPGFAYGGYAPAAYQAMIIIKTMCAGGTTFIKFEMADSKREFDAVHWPLFRKIIQWKMTPTLDQVRARTKVANVLVREWADTNDNCGDPHRFFGGLQMGANDTAWLFPQTGRYGTTIPIFDHRTDTTTRLSWLARKFKPYHETNTNAYRQSVYNSYYPDSGWGSAFVCHIKDSCWAMFNPFEDRPGQSSTCSFKVHLTVNSGDSLGGYFDRYAYMIMREAKDGLEMLLGNDDSSGAMHGYVGPRVTKLAFRGSGFTGQPGLSISGQNSCSRVWDATNKIDSLYIVHNGSVEIAWTTNGVTATNPGKQGLLPGARGMPKTTAWYSIDGRRIGTGAFAERNALSQGCVIVRSAAGRTKIELRALTR